MTFLNNTVQREGELGNVDNDGRITERGWEYFRKISLQQRKEDPYDNGDPLPPQQMKSLIVDLTGDDIAFFYDVVWMLCNLIWKEIINLIEGLSSN